MGSSGSKRQNSGSQLAMPGHQPSSDRPAAYRDTEPRIVLGNRSGYPISYWVVEEEEKRKWTKENQDRFIGSMETHLNGGKACECPAPAVDEARQETMDRGDKGAYFLTRDHRMEPMGGTQATKVPFPVGCRKLRVCAFFRGDDRWHLFQDKVYSIGLFRKAFTFTASDADITPCISVPATR